MFFVPVESDNDDRKSRCKRSIGSHKMLFTVHLSTSLTKVTPYRIVIYDVTDVNTENVYNVCTGRFKAQTDGLHAFFATVSTSKTGDIANESVCLIHNFHPADKSRQGTTCFEKEHYKTKTIRSLIDLKKGDEIWVMRLCKSSGIGDTKKKKYYSTFSGGLLEK